ncbi:MAG: hypothetical protein J5770_04775 [Bacteroidaceae bacterium]|nr:hypothetical protein [Bacteroidaceae bacterium]
MRRNSFLQSVLTVGLLFGCGVLASCNFSVNGIVTTETSADSDSIIIRMNGDVNLTSMESEEISEENEVEEAPMAFTRASVSGIYDTDDNDRLCFDEDGTGSSGRIGSLNFTSFDYFVDGDEIIITWGDESESRLKIRDGGKSVYWPENDLTFIKEE